MVLLLHGVAPNQGYAAAWTSNSVRMLCTFVRYLADFGVGGDGLDRNRQLSMSTSFIFRSPTSICFRKITGCHFKTHTKRMKITDVHLRSQWKNTSLSLHCTSPSSRPMKRLALKIVRSGERPHNMKWSQWRIWLFHILLNQKMNSNRDWLWLVNRCDSNLS